MAWADIAKTALAFGQDVMAGVSGNTKRYAAQLGKRYLNANMSTLQQQGAKATMKGLTKTLTNSLSDEGKKKVQDGIVKATNQMMKKGMTGDAIGKALNNADFTGIADKLLVNEFKKGNVAYKLGDALGGGIRDTVRTLKNGKGFSDALKAGFTKQVNGQTQIRAGRVAGAMFTAGVAGRVASGGGLYRDRYGRVNVPGVPFI